MKNNCGLWCKLGAQTHSILNSGSAASTGPWHAICYGLHSACQTLMVFNGGKKMGHRWSGTHCHCLSRGILFPPPETNSPADTKAKGKRDMGSVFYHISLPALFPAKLVFDYSSISQREEVWKQMSSILQYKVCYHFFSKKGSHSHPHKCTGKSFSALCVYFIESV